MRRVIKEVRNNRKRVDFEMVDGSGGDASTGDLFVYVGVAKDNCCDGNEEDNVEHRLCGLC
jgi:hypothetical protein